MRGALRAFVLGGAAVVALGMGCSESAAPPGPDPAGVGTEAARPPEAPGVGSEAASAAADKRTLQGDSNGAAGREGDPAAAAPAGDKPAPATADKAASAAADKAAPATANKTTAAAGEPTTAEPSGKGDTTAAAGDKGAGETAPGDQADRDKEAGKRALEALAAKPPTNDAAAPKPAPRPPPGGDPRFSVWMQGAKLKAGQQGAVQVVLVPKGDFHCNNQYPYKLKLGDPPAGVTYPQPIIKRGAMTVSPTRTVAHVPIVASAPGDVKISGTFSFSVCTESQCVIERRTVAAVVNVE